MKSMSLVLCFVMALVSCSRDEKGKKAEVSGSFVSGELAEVAKARNLSADDLLAAAKTYNPSGQYDEYLAFFGTGVSGRVAVVGMPSMKILKYVAVFSAEPWQGYAFDDESKAVIKSSSRDEVEYAFGDIGTPALSLTKGKHDAKAVFFADAANGRLGMVDLAEYETKQIVTNPLFKNSTPDVAVTENSEYVTQTTAAAESMSLGATFWRFVEKASEGEHAYLIDPATSFTVFLGGANQSAPATGRGETAGLAFSISRGEENFLNVIDWKKAAGLIATKATSLNGHLTLSEDVAVKAGILLRLPVASGADKIIVSGDGKTGLITSKTSDQVQLVDLKALAAGQLVAREINVGGPSVDAAFVKDSAYVTVHSPGQVVKLSISDKTVKSTMKLDFPAGKIVIPESDTVDAQERYAVVINHSPLGRFTRVGPQTGLSASLLSLQGEKMQILYNASIPQSTRLGAVAMSTAINKPVHKYKIGFDPRSGTISPYKTNSGKEMVVRNGKRVHVYATLIRSHITPDMIEVEQGDVVSIHLTSNEQSKDNVHGFTIDTYNVHGSFEPGKTASVTFVADRPGVFPYYCTEFCSALHLEMQGYLLVKPLSDKKLAEADQLLKLHNNKSMNEFFNYIRGE